MEAAIRFSQNAFPGGGEQQFLKVDVVNKSFKLCKVTKQSRKSVRYDIVDTCTKVPAFRAFDWHPIEESLVATGGSVGDATLLRITEGQHDSWAFSTRNQRACNAVALSAQNLLAVGLDRVRTDFCLNIWDLTQHIAGSSASRSFTKSYSDPLHKLAGGEAITSLKFYNNNPQLLVAGVKGQYVRLYDLRKPNNSPGLQFATKCVSNLAIDSLDENYFASCYPVNDPFVCIWDRRMANHVTSNQPNFVQSSFPSEVSLELPNVTQGAGVVWSLRFSKSRRGCLGVLTNAGHLKVFDIGKDFTSQEYEVANNFSQDQGSQHPQNIHLRETQDIERPTELMPPTDLKSRAVSFDFMTSIARNGQPKLIMLSGEDTIRITSMRAVPEPSAISTTDFICKGSNFGPAPGVDANATDVATAINKIRRNAEPRNSLKQAYKTSKHSRTAPKDRRPDLRRMSSFANHSWNTDLGFYERHVALEDLLTLLATPRLRCEAGYLLEPSKNRSVAADSQWTEAFWSWLERAERISKNQGMVQDNLDLSFVGAYSIWMEEIVTNPRQTGASFSSIAAVIKNTVARLQLPHLKGIKTDYPWYRKLCLYISGIPWSTDEVDSIVQKLSASNQHTKAAATAIFADEEKLAYKALRSKTASQSHKMLAMAIAGARRRKSKIESGPNSRSPTDSETDDDDWAQTISSLSADLNDPYARAILAYMKSGSWTEVVNVEALPLKQRLGVVLRHLSDADVTTFLGRMTRQVISSGDIEGVILTGTGTREGLELLQAYASRFNDLQTAVLGMSVGGAARKFMGNAPEDNVYVRRLEAMHEAYRSSIMSWGLKFHRVHFDISYARALNGPAQSPSTTSLNRPHNIPRPKEQIKLVCAFCTQSLTQFPAEDGLEAGQMTKYTAKNPLSSEKAAVQGTVCPKCGRHLPRCGVCDLWLGAPDDSFAKYSHTNTNTNTNNTRVRDSTGKGTSGTDSRHMSNDNNNNMTASMTASVVTTIGPQTNSSRGSGKKDSSNRPEQTTRSLSSQSLDSRGKIAGPDDEIEVGEQSIQVEKDRQEKENKWAEVMHKLTVFCVRCSHGFHAEHARLWFEGKGGQAGHRICPVPLCGCACNG